MYDVDEAVEFAEDACQSIVRHKFFGEFIFADGSSLMESNTELTVCEEGEPRENYSFYVIKSIEDNTYFSGFSESLDEQLITQYTPEFDSINEDAIRIFSSRQVCRSIRSILSEQGYQTIVVGLTLHI